MSEAKVSRARGPRRRMTMTDRVRRSLAQGMGPIEIAKKYKIDANYVRQIRWKDQKKQAPLPPLAGASIDFHYDASSLSLVPVTPVTSVEPTPEPQKNVESGGIVWLIDQQKDATPKPTAVEERKLTLWERIKFWAFGIRA
jgi:hypothetical protein